MNQIASAILILSATICAHISGDRPTNDGFGGLMGLTALGLGIWGTMSLMISVMRERERMLDDPSRLSSISSAAVNGLRSLAGNYATGLGPRPEAGLYRLSPETNAQVLAIAQMSGQDRSQVIEETLRRHLPRGGARRVA